MTPLRAGDPTSLGRYELLGRLGAGGMGTVFLGTDPDGVRVAVKVIRPEWSADPAFRARFRSEVRRARQVPPFCTAAVLDADTDHEPPYLVVEYVDGPSLAAVVRERGPLPASEVYALAVGVATALLAIHGAGVVHRDLKPANVLLAVGLPKVIDFGIARGVELTAELTAPDQVMGTVGYVAPESLDVSGADRTGPAADVFAWGVLVAYAATGKTPFAGESAMATIGRILTQPPDLSGLPAALRTLVGAALMKDPARRPAARELLDALLNRDATVVPAVTPELREVALAAQAGTRPPRRWPRRVLAAATVAALLAGTGLAAAQSRADAERQAARAERQSRMLVQQNLLARSSAALGGDPGLALRLAVSAYGLDHSARGRAAMTAALATGYAGELTARSPVTSVAFRPDGKAAVTGGTAAAEVWTLDGNRFRLASVVASGGGEVNDAVFSPDGRMLAVAGGQLRLWDVTDPVVPRLLLTRATSAPGGWESAQFSADGKKLLTVTDRTALWDITDREHPDVVWGEPIEDAPTPLARMTPDGRIVAATDQYGRVTVWRANSSGIPRRVATLDETVDDLTDIALSADGQRLALARAENGVRFYDLTDPRSPRRRGQIDTRSSALTVTFDSTGELAAIGNDDGATELWNVADLTEPLLLKEMSRTGGRIVSVAFSPDGTRLLTGGPHASQSAVLWEPIAFSPRELSVLGSAGADEFRTVGMSAQDLVAATSAGSVEMWDAADPQRPQPVATFGTPASGAGSGAVRLLPSKILFSGGSLLDLSGDKPRQVMPGLKAKKEWILDVDPDRGLIAVFERGDGGQGRVRIHRLAGDQPPPEVGSIAATMVYSARFGPGGTLAVADATSVTTSTVTVWNLTDPAHPMVAGAIPVESVGELRMAGGPGTTAWVEQDLTVWNNRNGSDRVVRTASRARRGHPLSLSTSADGTLLTVSTSRHTEIWGLGPDGDPMLLAVVRGRTSGAAISSRQPLLATAGVNGVTLWDVSTVQKVLSDPLPDACRRAGGLSEAEWSGYAPALDYEPACSG
ncbi:WD40 repeat domain-containing serine/threonine protein kinase [Actinoplanes subglobosus]|uniref:WD40 repeat domain-containing serine/threonine protein kinase n=1 Tax=Actinoplanes subglobosus TaxID=1547892 RepID=A0ABV8J0G7_9ACTN